MIADFNWPVSLVKELGINNVNINNPTYIPIDDSFETIMRSHNQFIISVGFEMSDEDQNLPHLYWTLKLHKSPYKHRFIAGSSTCTTKDQSTEYHKAFFPLSQLRPRQRPILSQKKAISMKDDCSTL